MVKIIIDDQTTEVAPGTMVIEAADNLGIYIPRYCYHKKLSIAANCRMCLVEVEKAPKTLPACATPVTDGMRVWTKSEKTKLSQRAVMEFLLINHPLDCPICDQGGECELQDLALQYGSSSSRFIEAKRAVADQNLGSLIATEMTRCIQCTRCVRFGEEIAGMKELGATGRGEHMQIGTFVERNMVSELSGNVIDLCPVGALTSKPFRFKARSWELQQTASVAAHDCLGANINIHTMRGKVLRVVPKENEAINEVWLTDRDRFSYEAINSRERLTTPLIKADGAWRAASWTEALDLINNNIQTIIQQDGAEQIGALISPNATIEEQYLLQKYLRLLGSHNIDHRLRQLDFSQQEYAPLFPNLGVSIAEIERQNLVLLVGADIHQQQPLIGLKLRKLTRKGGEICVINPRDCQLNFPVKLQEIVDLADLITPLAGIAKVLYDEDPSKAPSGAHSLLVAVKPNAAAWKLAANLQALPDKLILLGEFVLNHPQAADIIALANLIAKLCGAKLGVLPDGANSAGAWLAGCVPHRLPGGQAIVDGGKHALKMLQQPLAVYLLSGIEPELDSILGITAQRTLAQAKFVAALTAYKCPSLLEVATVLLPITLPAEMAGSLINVAGSWQQLRAAGKVADEVKPAWKIWRVLAVLADLAEFDYADLADVSTEIKNLVASQHELKSWDWWCPQRLELNYLVEPTTQLLWLSAVPLYHTDYVLRRAPALQSTEIALRAGQVWLNPSTAAQLGISADQQVMVKTYCGEIRLPAQLDANIPPQTVYIDQATPATALLGRPYVAVELNT